MIAHLKIKVLYAVCLLVASAVSAKMLSMSVCLSSQESVKTVCWKQTKSYLVIIACEVCFLHDCLKNPSCISQCAGFSVGSVGALQVLIPCRISPAKTVLTDRLSSVGTMHSFAVTCQL